MSNFINETKAEGVADSSILNEFQMDGILYRQARDTDYPSIEKIWTEGVEKLFSVTPLSNEVAAFKQNFRNRNSYSYWVAEYNGGIIGFQSYLPLSSNPLKKAILVESSTYISEQAQARKVAYFLIELSLNYLKTTDVMYVGAFIGNDNFGAIKLAEKFGYTLVGNIPSHTKNNKAYDNRVFMIKLIK